MHFNPVLQFILVNITEVSFCHLLKLAIVFTQKKKVCVCDFKGVFSILGITCFRMHTEKWGPAFTPLVANNYKLPTKEEQAVVLQGRVGH